MGRPWFGMVLRPLAPLLPELFTLSAFVSLLGLAVPVFVMQVYDRVLFHNGESTLAGLTLGILLVLGFELILRQARVRILQRLGLRLDVRLGGRLFDKFVDLPLARLEQRPAAEWNQLFRDVEVVRNTLAGPAALMPFDLLCGLLALSLICIIAWPIALVLTVWAGIYLVLAMAAGTLAARAGTRERDSVLARDGLVGELVNARTTIKALCLGPELRQRWQARHAHTITAALARGSSADTCANLGASLAMLGTVVATWAGARAILDQQMSIGALTAASMLSARLINPLNQLIGLGRAYTGLQQSAQRLCTAFALPEERAKSALPIDRVEGRLQLESVGFTHDGGRHPVFDGLSLDLAAGTLAGIRGANGSGKSTLLKLMQGLYVPDRGRVLIDGADLVQFSRGELARWVGYLPQECLLFAGSIRDNIAIAHAGASDDEVEAAARLAGADSIVRALPDGYATEVGEGGCRLSWGQRQRIALARALIGQPAIVLLDEPSSHLDAEASRALRATLTRLAERCTVVVVTHNSDLLNLCQRIIELDHGQIVFDGAWREVIGRRDERSTSAVSACEAQARQRVDGESFLAAAPGAGGLAPPARGAFPPGDVTTPAHGRARQAGGRT